MEKEKTKICFKCMRELPLSEFYKHLAMKDGYLNKCKDCTKKDVHENYYKNREYYSIYEEKRWKKEERKKDAIFYQQNRRKKNPQKNIAYLAVSRTLKAGKIKREPCALCGAKETQAHHEDYSKPLEVIWLCRKCHLLMHGKLAYDFKNEKQESKILEEVE